MTGNFSLVHRYFDAGIKYLKSKIKSDIYYGLTTLFHKMSNVLKKGEFSKYSLQSWYFLLSTCISMTNMAVLLYDRTFYHM